MSIKKIWTAVKPDLILGGGAAATALAVAVVASYALAPRPTATTGEPTIAPVARLADIAPATTPAPPPAPAAPAASDTPVAPTAAAPAAPAAAGEAKAPVAPAASASASGKAIYAATCSACHGAGVAGAPKVGDKAAWAPRLAQGLDGLVASAKKGKGVMPPKGGNAALSDGELAAAIAFMANQSGASFKVTPAAAPEPATTVAKTTADATPAAKVEPTAAPKVAPASPAAASSPAPAPMPAAAPAKAATGPGEAIYTATCSACHGTGVAGAPKVGDKAAWSPRLKQGLDGLVASAKKGKGVMPPKGGNAALSDAELAAAIAFMANQSGASFKVAAAPSADAGKPVDAKPEVKAEQKPEPKAEPKVEAKPAPAPEPPPVKAKAPATNINGKAIYAGTCIKCHDKGVDGAPRLGVIGDWVNRFNAGAETMLNNALKGKGKMPARGGNAKLSDDEVRAALEYMLGQFR